MVKATVRVFDDNGCVSEFETFASLRTLNTIGTVVVTQDGSLVCEMDAAYLEIG